MEKANETFGLDKGIPRCVGIRLQNGKAYALRLQIRQANNITMAMIMLIQAVIPRPTNHIIIFSTRSNLLSINSLKAVILESKWTI
jgi:hypothetical protein